MLRLKISLKAARVNKDMSQTEAAKAIGISKGTLINWELGRTSPNASKLTALCDLYGIPLENISLR